MLTNIRLCNWLCNRLCNWLYNWATMCVHLAAATIHQPHPTSFPHLGGCCDWHWWLWCNTVQWSSTRSVAGNSTATTQSHCSTVTAECQRRSKTTSDRIVPHSLIPWQVRLSSETTTTRFTSFHCCYCDHLPRSPPHVALIINLIQFTV